MFLKKAVSFNGSMQHAALYSNSLATTVELIDIEYEINISYYDNNLHLQNNNINNNKL